MAKLSLPKLEQKALEDINAIMQEYGYDPVYKEENLVFKGQDKNNGDFDTILFRTGISKLEKKYGFVVAGSRKLPFLDRFIDPYVSLLAPFTQAYRFQLQRYTLLTSDAFARSLDTEYDADSYSTAALRERLGILLPLVTQELDAMSSDIFVLDRLANGFGHDKSKINPQGGIGPYFHKMIIAKLAGNPQYEEIYRYYEDRCTKEVEKKSEFAEEAKVDLQIAHQLYEDLKQVKPLTGKGLLE